ncbi:MAG TPA: MauE/DoxX family redox-associated membrane protein [Chitinophagaceae bacterium]|jgi:cation transport ATPase|nr:MauE/DoxX family redox-associated membrane protein [Chitinophagaceae bacterium]
MTHTYNINGMTCGNCVAKAKSQLLQLGDVTEAAVQLTAPQATITMQKHIPVITLQNALSKAGTYTITEADGNMHHMEATVENTSWFVTYKPILIIGAYITGSTLLIEGVRGRFDWESWMSHFMGAFFLVFSFFKMLDLRGFAESYSTYDVVAKRWMGWGYVYAFIELLLGIAFLINFNSLLTNGVTFLVMSISIIGVLQSVLNKQKIKCACLGAVFNLPMSTVTIIEDALMIIMSGSMVALFVF